MQYGENRRSGEPTCRHRWQYKVSFFSEAAFIFKFEFAASVVRSSTYVLCIPLQLSWQPTPFWSLRVALDTSCRVALVVRTDASHSSYPSRRVAFSVRYVLYTWRVVHGLARSLRSNSHCKASRAEPNPFGLENKPTLWNGSIHSKRRTQPNGVERSRTETNRAGQSSTYVPCIPVQLSWQPTPFWSLHVALDTSCRVTLVVRTAASHSSYPSRRVAFSVRYLLNTWRVVQELARSLRPHSHCKANRDEQTRT